VSHNQYFSKEENQVEEKMSQCIADSKDRFCETFASILYVGMGHHLSFCNVVKIKEVYKIFLHYMSLNESLSFG